MQSKLKPETKKFVTGWTAGWTDRLVSRGASTKDLKISAPVPLCQSVIKRLDDFSSDETLRVAVGTYNINGGKHFRSVVYKNVSLDDWLIDPHKQNNESKYIFVFYGNFDFESFHLQPLLTLKNQDRTGRIRKLTCMLLDLRRWLTLTPKTS